MSWLSILLIVSQAAGAQAPTDRKSEVGGQISLLADFLPRRDATELRPQASIDATWRPSDGVRFKLEGFVEALVADRSGAVRTAAARVREAWVEASGAHGDIRVGFGRLVWGRLDEIQPSDVINPIDTARFLFDGRSAARLPVAFVRGRWFTSEKLVIEVIAVPVFRRGSFDELEEPSSPFNLLNDVVLPAAAGVFSPEVLRLEPDVTWRNMSGGGRASGTIGRVDLAAAAFRGFDGFGLLSFEPGVAVVGRLVERFPRFTMISADFETVVGEWAVRGESALFIEKTLRGANGLNVRGHAVDVGAGVDRRSGAVRIFASAVVHREWSADDSAVAKSDLNLVGSIERQFGRDQALARAFAVVNPADGSAFVRGLFVWRAQDNLAVEASAAAFLGTGDDTISRFKTRDFVLGRLRWMY